MSKWEICEIEENTLKEGFLFQKTYWQWKAIKRTPSGTKEVIFETKPVEVTQQWDQHQFLISRLASKGWEPTKHDEVGHVLSMKRRIDDPTSSRVTTDPTDLLQQLANLRAAGILTEQEFQTKKAEILKRM